MLVCTCFCVHYRERVCTSLPRTHALSGEHVFRGPCARAHFLQNHASMCIRIQITRTHTHIPANTHTQTHTHVCLCIHMCMLMCLRVCGYVSVRVGDLDTAIDSVFVFYIHLYKCI